MNGKEIRKGGSTPYGTTDNVYKRKILNIVRYIYIILLFILFKENVFSQEKRSYGIIFHTIKEAKTFNPDSVLYLELNNLSLSEFPKEVLIFKNLKELDFRNRHINHFGSSKVLSYLLTPEDKAQLDSVHKVNGRDLIGRSDSAFPTKHSNTFKAIDANICSLKKIQFIHFGNLDITEADYKLLLRCLPKAFVFCKFNKNKWEKMMRKYEKKYF